MRQWPLRIKITLLVGVVLTLACTILTVNSIYSARGYYSVLDETGAKPEIFEDRVEANSTGAGVDMQAGTGAEAGADTQVGTGTEPAVVPPPGEIAYPDSDSSYAIASRQFSIQSVLVMLAVILVSVALTYWLTGRLLCPLTALTDSIRAIDKGNLDRRVELPQATGEVRKLTESFNGMLERLKNSFEIQENFAANAAHELKTPIAVLKTSLQVLEIDDEPSREDYREFTNAARAATERLSGTVDALMALARGNKTVNMEDIAVRPLLELILSELKTRAEAGGVSLSISGDCPFVRGDTTLVYRALFNLVENAVKYTQPGGKVEVNISRQEGHARIEISDTGIGMSEDVIAHAFEPFYRADRSRSQRIPGSGLGLSVVKAIVEQLNGSIVLESTEGAGTTVTIIF